MMNSNQIKNLVQRLYEGRKADYLRPRIVEHLSQVGEGVKMVTNEITQKNPKLSRLFNIEEISLAGALHDIGRFLHYSQSFHEIRGYLWLLENGLQEGVAETKSQLERIAKIILPHSVVAEQFSLPENLWEIKQFYNIHIDMLFPSTWQQVIVSYTDLNIDKKGIIGDFEKRIEDLVIKANDQEYAESNPTLAKGLNLGMKRIKEMCQIVENLRKGKLQESQIKRYSFE